MTEQFWDPFAPTKPSPKAADSPAEAPVAPAVKKPRIERPGAHLPPPSMRRQAPTQPAAAPAAPPPPPVDPQGQTWNSWGAPASPPPGDVLFEDNPPPIIRHHAAAGDRLAGSCYLIMSIAGVAQWPASRSDQKKVLRRARRKTHPDLDLDRTAADRKQLWDLAIISPGMEALRPADDNVKALWDAIDEAAKVIGLDVKD